MKEEAIRNFGLSFSSKLYIWSILFEPLLFFILFEKSFFGFSGNLSKLLQALLILHILYNSLAKNKKVTFLNIYSKNTFYYFLYLIISILAGVIGFLQGSYQVPSDFYKQESYTLFSQFINGSNTRVFFEYMISFYNFIYFSIFPIYFINSKNHVLYFFKYFLILFKLSILLGIVDWGLSFFLNIDFIPRHIADWVHTGDRFHGLAGEPRDAFVYLVYSIAIINLYYYFKFDSYLPRKTIILVFILLLLTQSGSGIIGLLFSSILILIYFNNGFRLRHFVISSSVLLLFIIFAIFAVEFSDRLQLYIEIFPSMWESIGNGNEVPATYVGQMSNIYPLWDLYQQATHNNYFPLVLGRGLGSGSAVSNRVGEVGELFNAHSQFVRIIYESGILGLFFFVKAFVYPIKYGKNQLLGKPKMYVLFFTLLLIGSYFGHRSNCLYIFLGVFFAVVNVMNNKSMV